MHKLSVVIITFNEEKNIARCLESVQSVADEIIIVDSFSTDATESISKNYNVKFITHQWEGYSASKNFANSQATYDWILSLDADEALSDELKDSIIKAKKEKEIKAYKFNRLTNYCGSWIRHCGWYPDTKTRIFDRRVAKWEGIIHEQLIFYSNRKIELLPGDCLHFSFYTFEQHLMQTDKFTSISAQYLFNKGKKATYINIFISPMVSFFKGFFFRLGFLDGFYGFVICMVNSFATFIKYVKLRELQKKTSELS